MDVQILNRRVTFGNVYGPSSGDHPEFFDVLMREILYMDNELICIGGDWNVALDPKIDTKNVT